MNLYEQYLRAAASTKKLPPQPVPIHVEPERPAKGCCRYCGKKIGKGVHFHEKACKERQK